MSLRGRIISPLAVLAVTSGAGLSAGCSAGASADLRAADVNVSCAPSQRAVVKQTMSGATPQVNVLCLDAATVPAGFAVPDSGNVIQAGFPTTAVATPAVYYPQQLAAPVPRAPRLAPVSTAAPVRRDVSKKPSWQKRALVIGGSAGAGAGIGALVGGKKGAVIGAAIGGGGATLLDQIKNR